jgi:glutaredoxin
MLKEELHNITIRDLFNTNRISARAYNCCSNASLETLYDIISYYNKGKSFMRIRNLGHLTAVELENLCKEIIPQINHFKIDQSNTFKESSENEEKETHSLTEEALIEAKYSELINCCSVRTFNALKNFSAEVFIQSHLYKHNNELFNLKNIGKKSVDEIIALKSKFKSFIEEINKESHLELTKYEAKNKFDDLSENAFIHDFYKKSSHFPMLWIFEQKILSERKLEIEIFNNSFCVFNNYQKQTLNQIGLKYNLSRERIRQIRNDVFSNFFEITHIKPNKFNKLFSHKEDWIYLYESIKTNDIIYQDSIEIQNHLKDENCKFTSEFVMHIIVNLFRDNYTLYSGFNLSKRDKIWHNTFLIKNEFSAIFDIEKMREEFSNTIMNNETDYLLDIEDYIANSQCWIKYDYSKTNNIISIVRVILLYEFQLYSDDIVGLIKIPSNRESKPMAVIYKILQQNGKPMHIDEIFEEFKIILPEHKFTDASQLRSHLQRHEAISYRNRKSVYTLKEWNHIKSGTIRDAISEFLSKNDFPKTVDEITEYVLQFFPETNISSIRTTMSNDSQKRFSFFKDNLYGLNNKVYSSEYVIFKQHDLLRKSFEQKLHDLEIFIVENEHFPFASSEGSKESSLGRWWYRILNNKQQINESQQIEVDRVIVQYTEYDTDKSTYEWNKNYNIFKRFLLENRRIPSARGEEKFLYGWLSRAKEDFLNYNLTEEQRQKYIDLAKLI